jgi:hypothetical protein
LLFVFLPLAKQDSNTSSSASPEADGKTISKLGVHPLYILREIRFPASRSTDSILFLLLEKQNSSPSSSASPEAGYQSIDFPFPASGEAGQLKN